MKHFVIFIYFWLFPLIAKASNYKILQHIGTSLPYLIIKDDNFSYTNEREQVKNPNFSDLNYGITFIKNNIIADISSTIFSKDIKRSVISKNNGYTFLSKTKTRFNSISIGYKLNNITLSSYVANVKSKKRIYNNHNLIARDVESSIFYGLNINYFINKNIALSCNIIAPNEDFNIKLGSSMFGINFYF